MRVLSSVTCSWLFSVRTLASARRASSSACSDLRRAPRKASSSILALARRNLSSAIFSSGTSLALAPTAWAWAMARSVRRICSFGAGSVAQPASASTARAANRGRILTKKSLRFWGADRLQLPLPTLQIALQRGFGQAGGGQFCHLFRQLSAQPGVIAGRVVGNGEKQTGLIDRLRVGLEVVGHAQGLGGDHAGITPGQHVVDLAQQQFVQGRGQGRRTLESQALLAEGAERLGQPGL